MSTVRYCDICGATGARTLGTLYHVTEQSEGWCPHWYQVDYCAKCVQKLVDLTVAFAKITKEC